MIDGTAFAATAISGSWMHNTDGKLKVINLWAGPGAGKSTLAAAIFNVMKRERFEVELVAEYAKSLTYEKAMHRLENQLLVLAQQEHQLRRLIGQVEYAIVDSPFPMGLAYCKPEDVDRYQHLIDCMWDDYDNYDFFLQRTRKPYQQFGRNQTLGEAIELDASVRELWAEFGNGEFDPVDPDSSTVEWDVVDAVLKAQGLKTLGERYQDHADSSALAGGWHDE
jgi:hypothetical protein